MAATLLSEISAGVYAVAIGRGAVAPNVYFVRCEPSWVLIDSAWPHSADAIVRSARWVFGAAASPAAIVLTHIHPDHSGSARQLARRWSVPVMVHPAELPMAAGGHLPQCANPLDRRLLGPVLRRLPGRARARLAAAGRLTDVVRGFDPRAGVPCLPGWEAIPTPGHTPGHIALYRPEDGVLVTGDAVLTVDLNSIGGLVRAAPRVSAPPRYTTWDWPAAKSSLATLAKLRLWVLAPGHGRPLVSGTAPALQALADGWLARPRSGRERGRPEPPTACF